MSVANVVSGFVVGAAIVQTAIIVAFPVPAIVVHGLDYKDGVIHQERTVTTGGNHFPAEWRAVVMHADTRTPVQGCQGRGFWNYSAGRMTADLDLPTWVGSDDCTPEYLRMIGGEFYPVASWHWGNEFTEAEGAAFKP